MPLIGSLAKTLLHGDLHLPVQSMTLDNTIAFMHDTSQLR